MRTRDLVDVGTRGPFWSSQRQQGADLLKREAEVARTPDERQCPGFDWPVDPTAARSSGRRWQHFDPLIIANGLDIHAAVPGQLAYRQVFRSKRREGGHEIILDPVVTTGCMV